MPTSRLPPPGTPSREPSTDRDLVVRARTGDRAAWGELYARYADRLFDYAARLTGSRAQAADCVQDAFVLAVERIGQLRDPDAVRPWLYAIVRSTAQRHYRRTNRFSMQDVPDLPTDGGAGDDVMLESVTDRELAELLEEAARGLTDEDREVLDLSLRHDLSPADVAAALGVSTRHAAVTTERMRERLGRSVIVTVLARKPDCEEFAAIRRAEGALNPLSRKRLARHVDACATCGAQRDRQVRPEVLLGALPLLLLPRRAFADFEPMLDAALRRLQSGAEPSDGGLEWDDHGFPVVRHARRAKWLPWAAATLVGLLAGGGIVGWAVRDDAHGSTTIAAGSTSVVTAAPFDVAPFDVPPFDVATTVVASPVTLPPTSAPFGTVLPESIDSVARPLTPTSAPASAPATTLPDAVVPVTTTRPPTPTTRPPSTQPVATTPVATAPPTVTTSPNATTPTTASPTTVATTSPPTTAVPTTTTAPDTAGPTVGSSSASPTNIGATYFGTSTCNVPPANTTPYPTTSAFTVSITDPSGVQGATYSWSVGSATGGGTLFAGSGGSWSGTLGPVPTASVPISDPSGAQTFPMSVTVSATDTLGHVTSTTRSGVVIVHNCTIIL